MASRTLEVIWRHGSGSGRSRFVAADTGRSVRDVIEEIRPALDASGIGIAFEERAVPDGDEITVDGRSFGELLERVKEGHDYCHARSRREEMECRRHPLEDDGAIAAGFTEFMLRKALLLAIEGED
jgi:uncharacterized protein YqgV (UPF0045/DUF77 family)